MQIARRLLPIYGKGLWTRVFCFSYGHILWSWHLLRKNASTLVWFYCYFTTSLLATFLGLRCFPRQKLGTACKILFIAVSTLLLIKTNIIKRISVRILSFVIKTKGQITDKDKIT